MASSLALGFGAAVGCRWGTAVGAAVGAAAGTAVGATRVGCGRLEPGGRPGGFSGRMIFTDTDGR